MDKWIIRVLIFFEASSGFFLRANRGMDGNGRSAATQKKPLVADTDLVELLWHNGGVVAQPQTHPRPAPAANAANPTCASGLTGEETAAWFGDVDGLEIELYAQLWNSIADGPTAALPPPPHQAAPRPPMRSGIGSSWTGGGGDIGSTFCGSSSQVPDEAPAGGREEGSAALPSEGTRGNSTRDGAGTYTGTGTSSSGGSGSNFGGSGLPSESDHAHKRKGRGRDQSEDVEYEMTEETKSSRRHGSKRRTRAAEVHNLSERRRRDRINEKMRSLQELIPHCNKADKASILDEAIEYLKSLQMQVQIMWMTTGMAPMMFPGAHQFMPPMAVGMNSACMPAAQGLNQMARLPYMNHSMPNHMPMNQSAAISPMYVANQMQNIHLREASNHFLNPDGGQAAAPQVAGPYAYVPQIAPQDSSVVPTSGPGQPPTSERI